MTGDFRVGRIRNFSEQFGNFLRGSAPLTSGFAIFRNFF